MPSLREIPGQIASEGFVSGPIWHAKHSSVPLYNPHETPEADVVALLDAIAIASRQTLEMMSEATGDAVDILEFQLAMLEDDTFVESASNLILGGVNADIAWRRTLHEEISGYQESEDEYFRARAADLRDVHDRVSAALNGVEVQSIPNGVIYFGSDISPSMFLSHNWDGGGIALEAGSSTGHVAMLARQRGIPAIVNLGKIKECDGIDALIDTSKNALIIAPSDEAIKMFQAARSAFLQASEYAQKFADRAAETSDGTKVSILVNIADPAETEEIPIDHVDGIGLMRTEFLFGRTQALPSEELQFSAYKKVLEWAGEKPVTIRTVDAGGDKPIAGFTEDETNPFLGVRGIRLALKNQEIFTVQIRALLRAGVFGNLKVMLPMVATPKELADTRFLFEQEASALAKIGQEYKMPKLGIMVEVPSVAILPQEFSAAEFFSIGSNDLTQYVMAASRDNGSLSYLAKADNPAILHLIERVATYGRQSGQEVSLCGDAASDPMLVSKLLNAGLRTLSVAASRIGLIKAAVAKVDLQTLDLSTEQGQ